MDLASRVLGGVVPPDVVRGPLPGAAVRDEAVRPLLGALSVLGLLPRAAVRVETMQPLLGALSVLVGSLHLV